LDGDYLHEKRIKLICNSLVLPNSLQRHELVFIKCIQYISYLLYRVQSLVNLKSFGLDLLRVNGENTLDIELLMTTLNKLKHIQSFSFKLRELDPSALQVIGTKLRENKELSILCLCFSCAQVSKIQFSQFIQDLSLLSGLKEFSLKFDRVKNLKSQDLQIVPSALQKLTNLTVLSISLTEYKNLTDEFIFALVKTLSGFQNLTRLELDFSEHTE